MTEPGATYCTGNAVQPIEPLPRRALNLARRALEAERGCNGRGRMSFELIMIDGEWLITVSQPGRVERLGE